MNYGEHRNILSFKKAFMPVSIHQETRRYDFGPFEIKHYKEFRDDRKLNHFYPRPMGKQCTVYWILYLGELLAGANVAGST